MTTNDRGPPPSLRPSMCLQARSSAPVSLGIKNGCGFSSGWTRRPRRISRPSHRGPRHLHKHPTVRRWLKYHPRFHLHFTPTASSWLNLIERWFRDLTTRRLRRESSGMSGRCNPPSSSIAHHNTRPRLLTWVATRSWRKLAVPIGL